MSDIKKVNVSFVGSDEYYDISIGSNLIEQFNELFDVSQYSKVFVLSDDKVAPLHADKLPVGAKLITIKSGESAKNIETIQQIWQQLFDGGADRKSLLINLGGGVIGDLGGFVASTYMRGIDFINIPTTLLAAADASIGGKTGFNFAGIKNLLGTFAQPKAVIIDVDAFKTLDKRTFNEGFAEIIKHAAVFDEHYFAELEKLLPSPNPEQLIDILQKSSQLKADTVMADEKESGERKLLNFGHTIGHAVESLSHEQSTPLLHGEAVAIGMVAEARLGEEANITSPGTVDRIISLLSKVNLPTEIPAWAIKEKLDTKISKDKKNHGTRINWVMLGQIGSAKVDVQLD